VPTTGGDVGKQAGVTSKLYSILSSVKTKHKSCSIWKFLLKSGLGCHTPHNVATCRSDRQNRFILTFGSQSLPVNSLENPEINEIQII